MTKFNKVGKSTFVIAILSFLLVAVLAFGGTYAYFSAKTNTFKGNITMGELYVDLTDASGSTVTLGAIDLAQPNQRILDRSAEPYKVNMVKKENGETYTSNIAAYIRVKITAELDSAKYPTTGTGANIKYNRTDNGADKDIITPLNIFTIDAGDGWYQHTDGYTYYIEGTTGTADSTTKAVTGGSVDLALTITLNKDVGKGGSTFFMGATGTYTIAIEVIQAQYLDSTTTPSGTYTVTELAAKWATVADYPVEDGE
jgi:predicted ribosomally synthesized peptide with SipW-like signal peptide